MELVYVSKKGLICDSYIKALFEIQSIKLTMCFSSVGELGLMRKSKSVMKLPFGIRRYRL